MNEPLLSAHGLRSGYGAVEVLRGIDLDVHPGEIVALLGSNGAGKTTFNQTVSALVTARAGTIRFDGAVAAAQAAGGEQRLGHAAGSATRARRCAAPCPR